MFCEIFGYEKVLFYYFIEGWFESGKLLDCSSIILENASSYSLHRGFQNLE